MPVLNEEKILQQSITTLDEYMAKHLPYRYQITIADNGSQDKTLETAKNLAEKHQSVRVVSLAERGRGRALKQVWQNSPADILAYMDVDLSTSLDDFLPMIQPLVALLLSNEVALRKSTLDEAKARDVLSRNVAEIKKLTELSNSLLDLAKSDTVSGKPEMTNPYRLVEEILVQYKPAARAKHVKLSYDKAAQTPELLLLQAGAIRQIMVILLDNAIKYAPPRRGEVAVKIAVKKQALEFTVKDNGPGIAPSDQQRIFERFYRADAARTRTDVSGHGLGLAIAQSLADRCSYAIRVKSQPSNGAEFTLVVPFSDS